MRPDFGIRAWGRRRDGRLSAGERLGLAFQGVRAVLRNAIDRRRAPPPEFVLDLRPPSSSLSRRAEALLGETSADWLVQHGYRTYAWARIIAARDDVRFDDELLYCAGLLHDLGITERFLPPAGKCFALYGGDAAEHALREAGMPAERAAIVAEAIALHLNLVVELRRHGPEAHLLRAATALDVIGQDAHALSQSMKDDVLARHPRGDFKDGVCAAMRLQAERSPTTRVGFFVRRLRLLERVQAAPFDS